MTDKVQTETRTPYITQPNRLATYATLDARAMPQQGGAPRTYAVTFIRAGKVKARDQSDTLWTIPAHVLQAAAPLLEGRAVFLDHSKADFFCDGHPSLRDLAGITSNVTYEERTASLQGQIKLYDRDDLHWLPTLLNAIIADQDGGKPIPDIGLSIAFFADDTYNERGNERTTTRITHIESADLVFGPAAQGRINQILLSTVAAGLAPAHNQGDNTMEPITQTPVQPDSVGATSPAPTPATPAPAPLGPTLTDLAAILSQVESLNARIEQLATTTAALTQQQVIRGMGTPPTPQPSNRPIVQGMWNSVDRLQLAYEHLMGLNPSGDFERLTGIRELYMLLTGDRGLTGRFNRDIAQLAYNPSGNNADTTSMAELTRNVMNKALIQQIDLLTEYTWWRRIAYVQNFSNLNQISWIRYGGIGDIPTVAEKAEYTQLVWDDARVTADWVKKGGYLPLSLEMIDRDDLQAWREVPRILATSALVTISSVISALFTDNSGVGPEITTEGSTAYAFSSTWGNLITQPLTYENWQTAVETMYKRNQLNVSGRRIAVRPKFLLVPVEQEAQGISVVTSDRRPGTNFNDRVPTKRMLPEENVITVPHWTDADDWAAIADPALCPFVGVGFRYGETPELFTASDPNTILLFYNDVLPIKVRWFFAVSVIDPRGAVKSNA